MGEAWVPPTERIGRYEVVLPIAKGGMATVYLARAEGVGGFDRYVALKLTSEGLREDPEFCHHLIEEAKLVAHLRHLNVVPVLDVGECPKGVFLVMEYIPGDSLSGLLRAADRAGTPVPSRVGLRILVDALGGLHAAHEHADEDGRPLDLVHRDFSPQNILVGTDGIARLTDFGIAKAVTRASTTSAGAIKGKISYVSPEQVRGGRKLDRTCDLWSAGVIAWELLARQRLFGAGEEALLSIVREEPPRLKSVAPEVPDELEEVIASVLKHDPGARTATAAELARQITAAARPAGLLAEADEVAEVVTRLTAAKLAQRKDQIAEARRQRSQSSPDTPRGVVLETPHASRRPLPPLPEVPVTTTLVPVVPPRAHAPAPGDRPAPERARLRSDADAAPRGAALTPPGGLLAQPRAQLVILVAGGLVALGIFVAGVSLFVGGVKKDARPAASASASEGTETTEIPAASTNAPTQTTMPTRPGQAPDEGLWPATLEISADAPIASVRVGGRSNEITVPTPKVTVDLDPDEAGHDVRVVASSADGRTVSVVAKDGAVTLTFANAALVTAPAPVLQAHGKPPRKRK